MWFTPLWIIKMSRTIWLAVACRMLTGVLFTTNSCLADDRPNTPVDFNRDIRPILSENCFFCHGPDKHTRKADLRLDTQEGQREVRDGQPVIAPSEAAKSELFRRITSPDADLRMPPAEARKTLKPNQIELIQRWIAEGAVWKQHWAYQPPKKAPTPEVRDAAWSDHAIDRFLLARLDQERLSPSPDADPRTLVRRLHLDLTGLPPTPAEVDAFADSALRNRGTHDSGSSALETLVDRLLASPHYGERMAMHWLDLVRYADTVGYHGDQEHAISPYRDWVIHAFNSNLPFDQFTIEQLAGDLLPEPTVDQHIATGYNRLLQTSHEGGVQKKEYLAKYSADRVRNVSSVWLGATVACAECHDHKFDPIKQRDFYSLAAFFADVNDDLTFKGGDTTPTKREPEMMVLSPIDRQLGRKTERRTMVTVAIAPRPIRVLSRGDWMDETGEIVSPAVPGFLSPIAGQERATRLDLATWLVSPENPLVARVFVNRLWKLFFGKGIAGRLDDFGAQGEPPVHPELLDWLAVEFVEGGWDVKRAVKQIVLSRAYRQSSLDRPELRLRDPDNRLLARQSRWRLDAELIRDNALAVSGLLTRELGGPSARPYQPAGYYEFLNFPKRDYKPDAGANQYRRGLYTHWQRVFLHPMLKAFDAPSREECTAERSTSNTPSAALVLLNDPTFLEAARVFAARIVKEGGETTDQRLTWAWREALSRKPTDREMQIARQLYEQDLAEYQADPATAKQLLSIGLSPGPAGIDPAVLAAWVSVARALFNLNATITRN